MAASIQTHISATDSRTNERLALSRGGTGRKVAAVCFRQRGENVEFLLVKTDSGRWTFPKGSVEDGLSESSSAEMEALEEAGVMGKIEESHFESYLHIRRDREVVVKAFLLEVIKRGRPLERHRDPAWCGAEEAKRKLSRDRASKYADELCRVVDQAILRIEAFQLS